MKNRRVDIGKMNVSVATLLIKGLTEGKLVKEVEEDLKKRDLRPHSASTLEKYLRELRFRNKCKTTEQLMFELGRGMQLKIN